MPTYMQKRRRRWYAILEIPKELRPSFAGLARFVKSLDTESVTVGQRRVGEVVREWKADLDRARVATGRPALGSDDDAAYFARALRNATTPAQRDEIMEHIEHQADQIGYADADREPGQPPSASVKANEFWAKATGGRVSTVEHLDAWLAQSGSAAKTKDMHKADVLRFAARFPMLHDVKRPEVKRWVTSLAGEQELAPKTIQRVLSGLRGYWGWLQTMGVASETDEPFAKLDVARQAKNSRSGIERRQPFEPADVPRLLAAALARDDGEMADLIRLAMWTGCRIEELCALKVADVNGDSFRVREAKSSAGVRVVPIHAELQPTMVRLIRDSRDGYVLSGLTFNKYGDRSNAIGKRFGRMKTALGFGDPYVFHSFRKSVVTILENAGVSENVVADIVGHEKPRITYGLYSGGATLEVKREALAKLTYPALG